MSKDALLHPMICSKNVEFGYVTINPGTPREARLWREGIKLDATGTRAADSRADRRQQNRRLFKNPQNANSSRRPDAQKSFNAEGPEELLTQMSASEAIAEALEMRQRDSYDWHKLNSMQKSQKLGIITKLRKAASTTKKHWTTLHFLTGGREQWQTKLLAWNC